MKKNKPKIIVWDLEILADMDEVREIFFSIGDYPGRTMKASINSIICFGYKELGEKKARCISAWDFPRRWMKDINDDYEVVKRAGDILREADGIITHYGKGFDFKFLQSRLVFHDLPLLPDIPHVDTKYVASTNFFFYSNSLAHLAKFLGCKYQKINTSGKGMWVGCAKREKKSQREMARYCRGDVNTLEDVFNKLIAKVKHLPNYNFWSQGMCCANCGSFRLQKNGYRVTASASYHRMMCMDCGTHLRLGKKDKTPRAA